MANNKSSLVLPKAIVEMNNRMTQEEKRELSRLLNLKELEQLKEAKSSANGRCQGDPKFYLGTTTKGLNLEIPREKVITVFQLFLRELSPEKIEIFLSGSKDFEESQLTPDAFQDLPTAEPEYFIDLYTFIELDDNEIISSGEGCMSIVLSPSLMPKRSKIATEVFKACGYSHEFKSTEFYAIVWDDNLEVKEK